MQVHFTGNSRIPSLWRFEKSESSRDCAASGLDGPTARGFLKRGGVVPGGGVSIVLLTLTLRIVN